MPTISGMLIISPGMWTKPITFISMTTTACLISTSHLVTGLFPGRQSERRLLKKTMALWSSKDVQLRRHRRVSRDSGDIFNERRDTPCLLSRHCRGAPDSPAQAALYYDPPWVCYA